MHKYRSSSRRDTNERKRTESESTKIREEGEQRYGMSSTSLLEEGLLTETGYKGEDPENNGNQCTDVSETN